MSSSGFNATLLIGPTVPVPAPINLLNAINTIQVTNTDEGRDGFQITFDVGRSGPEDIADYQVLNSQLLNVFNRVIIMVNFGLEPNVLIDGIITHQELTPTQEPGKSTLTVTGEDVSVMMDMEEKTQTFPNMPDMLIASQIISSYAQYGLVPNITPPESVDVPLILDWIPSYQGSDYSYLQYLASKNAYRFYIEPTAVPGVNNAYWGPLNLVPPIPQSSLSVTMGPDTNVKSISFRYNALRPFFINSNVNDSLTNSSIPVQTFASLRPPLSSEPAWLVNQPNVRAKQMESGGLSVMEAFTKAQALTDDSTDAVTATGELDSVAYGDILQARKLVGVRGAGYSYDGIYYVKSVTHTIKLGEYKQSFTLARGGVGSSISTVSL